MHVYAWRPKDIVSPGDGVVASCELPSVYAQN